MIKGSFDRRNHPSLRPGNPVDRWARNRIFARLERLSRGRFEIRDATGSRVFGAPDDQPILFQVHDAAFYRRAMLGQLSIAESYIDGQWDCDDLVGLFQLFLRERKILDVGPAWLARVFNLKNVVAHRLNRNSRSGSRRNIAAHYDFGNEFFRTWLDGTMAYSSGVFAEPQTSMFQASLDKFQRICQKLQLQPTDEVLEIGTGFGGFAIHAAEHCGCQVTTTTISEQQFEEASSRINSHPASERIRLLAQDYRQLEGTFDKLVSIEMVEAVGHRFLDRFFRKCSDLLRQDGSMVLQAIVMPEKQHARYRRSVDFLQRYVFPGGCLPSLASLLESAGRASDFRFVHAEDMAPHYAQTLRHWRSSFESNIDQIRDAGYSDRQIRLWRYYLCYCEAAFEERYIGVLQIQFDKPGCRRDPLLISKWAADSLSTQPKIRSQAAALGRVVR